MLSIFILKLLVDGSFVFIRIPKQKPCKASDERRGKQNKKKDFNVLIAVG